MNRQNKRRNNNNNNSQGMRPGDMDSQGMRWDRNMRRLMGKPVGVSMANGQGTSGVLCSISNGELYLLEYLYQNQFAMKHYPLNSIQDVHPFPPCQRQPNPSPQPPPPRPPLY